MITGKFITSNDDWSDVLNVRRAVFSEANSICSPEADSGDAMAIYAITFESDGTAGACGRLFMDTDNVATISSVGSLPSMRGHGLADLAMRMLLYRVLEMDLPLVKLISQTSLTPFFERYGLSADGEPFSINGTECVKMSAFRDDINIEGSCHCKK